MLFHTVFGKFGEGVTLKDWFLVIYNGLSLDLSMAGYISILPFLLVILSVWIKPDLIKKIINVYSYIIIAVVVIVFSVDLDLYTYWGFRLDSTPLAFLKTPGDAFASFTPVLIVRQICILAVYFTILFVLYKKFIASSIDCFDHVKWPAALIILLAAALLILPIRGGFTDATMNVGWVYFSKNMFLNHAAINPLWNLMASLGKNEDFEGRYHFVDDEKAQAIVQSMLHSGLPKDQVQVIKAERPNVILVMLESFSAQVIESLGGMEGVTPNLNELSKEGVLFTDFYATSFRTDRGVSAIMSAYPSQPQHCIMKYPTKTNDLPNIGKSLTKEDYNLSFYYGGDANFTNMRSYLVNAGFQRIISIDDFARKDYASRWGAADHIVFNRMLDDLKERDKTKPFFNTLLTLSSHEPFTVPIETKFEGKDNDALYKNSIYYTDSCIGNFIEEAKKQDWWDNTVIVFISDHAYPIPNGMPSHTPGRHHIIMLWLGGAVKEPMEVTKIGYQPDFVVTLLDQLHIESSEFTFGKNLLDNNGTEFAFYTYNHGMGLIEKDGICIVDLNTNEPIMKDGAPAVCEKGEAFLQYSFEDFANR